MDDVEIISMLMPSAASVSNMVADTPGWVFMPAPMIDTVAMSGSAMTSVAPISACKPRATCGRHVEVLAGHGEGDVGGAVDGTRSARSCRR